MRVILPSYAVCIRVRPGCKAPIQCHQPTTQASKQGSPTAMIITPFLDFDYYYVPPLLLWQQQPWRPSSVLISSVVDIRCHCILPCFCSSKFHPCADASIIDFVCIPLHASNAEAGRSQPTWTEDRYTDGRTHHTHTYPSWLAKDEDPLRQSPPKQRQRPEPVTEETSSMLASSLVGCFDAWTDGRCQALLVHWMKWPFSSKSCRSRISYHRWWFANARHRWFLISSIRRAPLNSC